MSTASKILLASLLSAVFLGSAAAQRSGLGLKAGPQFCTYKATNIRTTMVPGFTLGAYAPLGAAPRLELQPELLLTLMGTGMIEPDEDRFTLRTVYIQAPISAKYYLDNVINLQGGVQMGKLLMAQRTDASGTTNVREGYKTFDMGFNLGLGFDLSSGVDISLRYYSGMPTLLKNDQALYPRNRSYQLTIGKRLRPMRKMGITRRRR